MTEVEVLPSTESKQESEVPATEPTVSGGRFAKMGGDGVISGVNSLRSSTVVKQKIMRLNPETIRLAPSTLLYLRPGGNKRKPKPFTSASKRTVRRKKVGIRKEYTLEQLLSVRGKFINFPSGIESIVDIFEAGLGSEIGKNSEEVEAQTRGTVIKFFNKKKDDKTAKGEGDEKTSGDSGRSRLSKKSKAAWVPHSIRMARGEQKEDPVELFERNIRSLLNKITLDNFENLSGKVIILFEEDVTDSEQLEKLVSLIFEKTVGEPLFSPLYAKLCVQIAAIPKMFTYTFTDNTTGQSSVKECGFHHILLRQCQHEFRKGSVQPEILPEMSKEDKNIAYMNQKKLLIGTIKFIGQLYNHGLLPNMIIFSCVQSLIGSAPRPEEDDIECVANLLETVGKKLDDGIPDKIKLFYRRLQNIQRDKQYSPRIRILIRNLLEIRAANWENTQAQKLKSLTEVHEEFEREHGKVETMKKRPKEADDADSALLDYMLAGDSSIANVLGLNSGIDERIHGGDLPASALIGRSQKVVPGFRDRYNTRNRQETAQTNVVTSNIANIRERQRNFLLPSSASKISGAPGVVTTQTTTTVRVVKRSRHRRILRKVPQTRPCEVGLDLEKDTLVDIFNSFATTERSENEFFEELLKYHVERHTMFYTLFDSATQKSPPQQEMAGNLFVHMADMFYVTGDEIIQGFVENEYWDYYTAFEADDPRLADNVARVLAPLFGSDVILLSMFAEFLEKDSQMKRPYKRDSPFSKQKRVIASMLKELARIGKDVVAICEDHNFNLDQFVTDEERDGFIQEFGLEGIV